MMMNCSHPMARIHLSLFVGGLEKAFDKSDRARSWEIEEPTTRPKCSTLKWKKLFVGQPLLWNGDRRKVNNCEDPAAAVGSIRFWLNSPQESWKLDDVIYSANIDAFVSVERVMRGYECDVGWAETRFSKRRTTLSKWHDWWKVRVEKASGHGIEPPK